MKILDFIQHDIEREHPRIYDTCSILKEMAAKKFRERMFKETRLKNIIPYATDRDADVFADGEDVAFIIVDNDKILRKSKYANKKYFLARVTREETNIILESNDKEKLLDAYAYIVSLGLAYANNTTTEFEETKRALREFLEDKTAGV